MKHVFTVFALLTFFTAAQGTTDNNGAKPVTVHPDRRCGDNSIADAEWVRLQPGERAQLTIFAKSRWNASNLYLHEGSSYTITSVHYQDWGDASICHNDNQNPICEKEKRGLTIHGWQPVAAKSATTNPVLPLQTPFLERKIFQLMEGFRRVPEQSWFRLIGINHDGCNVQTIDLAKQSFTATHSGQFCSFANDHPWTYGNNHGSLVLTIQRDDSTDAAAR